MVRLGQVHTTPEAEVVSSLVYAATASDVQNVIIDGREVMRDRTLLTLDEAEVIAEANAQAELLMSRAGLAGD
jgi:5-methylthioadenosine/S-adenosylhomocysteine deaminase